MRRGSRETRDGREILLRNENNVESEQSSNAFESSNRGSVLTYVAELNASVTDVERHMHRSGNRNRNGAHQ